MAKKDKQTRDAHPPPFSFGQPVVAVGRAPRNEAPFVPSKKELEEGIRVASKVNEAAAEEFRRSGRRNK
jgi:hypothetical protein